MLGVQLFREYMLLDHIASSANELLEGTKVVTFDSHEDSKWDIECVETGVRIFSVDGTDLG